MPTIISHPLVSVTLASWFGPRLISVRLVVAAFVASILPDADVLGFKLGIPYGHTFGHRGFSHSIMFAVIVGLLGIVAAPWFRVNRTVAFIMLFLSTLSHGILDAMTSGGLGIAFFSPFSNERYFFDWRFIKVSPLSIEPFLSERGWRVIRSEFLWIWLPALSLTFVGVVLRRSVRWLTNR